MEAFAKTIDDYLYSLNKIYENILEHIENNNYKFVQQFLDDINRTKPKSYEQEMMYRTINHIGFRNLHNFINFTDKSNNKYLLLLMGANGLNELFNINKSICQLKFNIDNLTFYIINKNTINLKKIFNKSTNYNAEYNKTDTYLDDIDDDLEIYNSKNASVITTDPILRDIMTRDKPLNDIFIPYDCLLSTNNINQNDKVDDEIDDKIDDKIVKKRGRPKKISTDIT
jgi:hypothetical protein